MTHIPELALAVLVVAGVAACGARAVGVNWGTAASHPLPPEKVVELLKANKISKVRLSDADPGVLRALSGSDIAVTVGIPDEMLRSLNSSPKAAEGWVHDNLTRYIPGVKIQYDMIIFLVFFSEFAIALLLDPRISD